MCAHTTCIVRAV